MIIHTIVYNQNNLKLPKSNLNFDLVIWNYNSILELIKNKYPDYVVFFKRLILNKSRENFSKYIIIKEYGGIFININLLKLFKQDDMLILENFINSDEEMIFWSGEYKFDLIYDIFEINDNIINDDIFIIKNQSNIFIDFLLLKINKDIIPKNEYQNKIYLGNIFLSNQLDTFYSTNLNHKIKLNTTWFGFGTNLKSQFKSDSTNKYEKAIYYLKVNREFPFDLKYKLITYPNVPELVNSEKILESWNIFYKIKNYTENMLILIIFQHTNWIITLVLITLITILNYFFKNYISNILNVNIKQAHVDSQVFFNPKKYKFLKTLQKKWKIIQEEALNVMINSPKLNVSRTIDDWHGAQSYVDTIKNKHGWIRSWSYEPEGTVDDQTLDGNYEWLNYGLLYFGDIFNENIKYCPKTMEILEEFK